MKSKGVVLVVMDGIGIAPEGPGNAVSLAHTPTLDRYFDTYDVTALKAHGTAVGLPSDEDMGNSEVGHNAIGCGQVYSQGAKLVNESIETGSVFSGKAWGDLIKCKTLHFIGLLSDGGVHSQMTHLYALLEQAKADGVKAVKVHILLDGRDVPPTSALEYVDALERKLAELGDESFDCSIASGGGRMKITMDRYEADWAMVERGWQHHVHGKGRLFPSAAAAIETYRAEIPGVVDQDLPGFVIEGYEGMKDGDGVVLFNFRGDRAMELSRAFDEENFDKFDRSPIPKVCFAGMLEYDADLKLPRRFLVEPPHIEHTLSQRLIEAGVRQYALSETQKYGHVTYFWNGNRSGKMDEATEDYLEIPSDVISFDQAPVMKAEQIAKAMVEAIESGKYGFLRCNFPNGDMVGHTGDLQATVEGVEAVDRGLAAIEKAAKDAGYTMVITADYGNAEEMLSKNKDGSFSPKSAHTLNPVPFMVLDENVRLKKGDFGLANIAATIAQLLGVEGDEHWEESLIDG
ncbi:MAG: 2,3-bisphosphoglycerate-independent phosphoglycerate mutase [Oscillospiraceae bacterium]|nr:2,3-bisphosphoglycerate-independent phosphoglycerate mutase [Oscillospiraceae bacterium]